MHALVTDPCCLFGLVALGTAAVGWLSGITVAHLRRALRAREERRGRA
jgi:hypothetical protein